MKQQLEKIYQDALKIIQSSKSIEEVDKNKNQFIGKKGQITQILKGLKNLSIEEKKDIGKRANEISSLIEAFSIDTKSLVKEKVFEEMSKNEQFDFLQPIKKTNLGRLHPISQIQYEIEDIFTSMGFSIMDGMEIESDHNNFSALNFSEDHPARDMQDTFYLKNGYLLRTHTSSVQVQALKNMKPPFQMIAPGRVFRYEEVDASHETTFYQVEGMVVDKNISISNLVYVMQVLLKEIFQTDKLKTRLRPGYFPFVEPGFELDISCLMCEGNGCQVCKKSGWLELLPCGLVHPNVFSLAGLNPKEWSGFAFGLGLDRLVMMRYGINDIRYFHSGNLRFLQQF